MKIDDLRIDNLINIDISEGLDNTIRTITTVMKIIGKLSESKNEKATAMLRIGTVLTSTILARVIEGKNPKNFSKDEWKEILNLVINEAILIDEAAYTVSVFNFYSAFINTSADQFIRLLSEDRIQSIRAISDEIRNETELFIDGAINEVQYIENCLWLCLEAIVKLLSATIGVRTIPEVAILIDAASSYAFEFGRLALYRTEQTIISEYLENQHILDEELQAKYDAYLKNLKKETARFEILIQNAFAEDFRESFRASIELARAAGVPGEELLHDRNEIDDYFTL